MFNKDSLILGIFMGLAIPFVGYAVILMIFEQIGASEWLNSEARDITFRARTIAVLAVCLNILPFRYYQKQFYQSSMSGVVFATLIYVGLWMFKFSANLF